MDTNEIMTNEDVMEVTEKIATVGSGNGFKVAVGIGLAVVVGEMAYRYIIKPRLAKIKTKKNLHVVNAETDDSDNDNDERFDDAE